MRDLQEQVERSIRAHGLFRHGQRMLVAVSGGVDSMSLLHLLHILAAGHKWKPTVAHFNHQLRGRSSDADERLVRQTASAFKLAFVAGRADVKSHAKRHGLSVEMAARQLRHRFLARTARKLRISTVALAHHADDQVELFFLRALRGAGGEGLAGMKWSSPSPAHAAVRLARPLLGVGKAELLRFARESRIRFREDATNASRDILRNRIRHELLPLLRRRYPPGLDKTIARLMAIVGAEAEVVTAAAQSWLGRRRPAFARLPVAVQRRALQLQLQQHRRAADFETIERLREQEDRPVSLGPALSVFRTRGGRVQTLAVRPVLFNTKRHAVPLKRRTGAIRFGGLRFRWRFQAVRGDRRMPRAGRTEWFDADRVGPRILLRHWQPGDRYQPIGMTGRVKLQDWFANRRVPRARRHELVIAENSRGEIFWIEGERIAVACRLTPQTRRRLEWRWFRVA